MDIIKFTFPKETGVVSFLQCHNMVDPNVIKLSNDYQPLEYMAL